MLTLSAADTEATIMVPITDDMDSESRSVLCGPATVVVPAR